MARKHRKLFPALTETNQTIFCSEFCYPACSYNCEPPYPEDYYFQPPPPPPPSPSDVHHSKQILHNSPYLIISLSLLASFLLLVSYYVFIVRSGFGWCRRRNNRPVPSQSDRTDEESLDENQVDHPIWFITTVGLQQSVISSISVCKYKKEEGLVEGTECSVCLNEFQEDETLRLLPKCNHAFHIPCIDTWLRSHTNCPLCRANIVTDTVTLDIVRRPLASVDQNTNSLDSNEATQMVNTGIDAENRTGTEDEGESQEVNGDRTSKEGVNSSGNRVFQVLGDATDAHQDVDGGIQPVRRSVSMDSSFPAAIDLGLDNFYAAESEGSSVINQIEVAEKDGEYSSVHRLMGNSSIEQCLHIRPVSMKRSFSSGGRFLSSRHNQSLNSIISF